MYYFHAKAKSLDYTEASSNILRDWTFKKDYYTNKHKHQIVSYLVIGFSYYTCVVGDREVELQEASSVGKSSRVLLQVGIISTYTTPVKADNKV